MSDTYTLARDVALIGGPNDGAIITANAALDLLRAGTHALQIDTDGVGRKVIEIGIVSREITHRCPECRSDDD